jgi:hypothetical protein
MQTNMTAGRVPQIGVLLRGEPEKIQSSMAHTTGAQAAFYVLIIILGAGLYGGAVGSWRSPIQGAFTAVKFPLILLLTTFGNAMLNAMLAPLLGLNLRFRQTLLAVLMSFTIAAAILGSFGPLVWYFTWNMPRLEQGATGAITVHSIHLLTQVLLIAFAGIVANLRLVQLLRRLSGSAVIARRILLAWLAGNLLLGSQLSWLLRPFVGSPGLPVEFLRKEAFHGNFFEAVLRAAKHLLT